MVAKEHYSGLIYTLQNQWILIVPKKRVSMDNERSNEKYSTQYPMPANELRFDICK